MEFQRLLYKSVLWRSLFFASQLLLNVLIARYLEPAGSGWLFYTLNNYAFLLLVISICIESGMGYFLASGRIGPGKLLSLALAWAFGATAIVFLLFPLFSSFQYNGNVTNEMIPLAYIAGTLLVSFFSALFYARKEYFTPNIIAIGINILLALFLVIQPGKESSRISNTDFFYVYCLSFLVQGLLLTLFFKINQAAADQFSLPAGPEMKLLLKYSLLVFVGNLLTFLVFRVDYWLIHYLGRSGEELGNYIQVSKLAQLFFMLPSIFAGVVFPLAAGGNFPLHQDLKILSRFIVVIAGGACLLLILTGYWLFPAVFGEGFEQMYIPFLFLVPGIIAISLAYPLAGYFAGKNKVWVNVVSSLLALTFLVPTDIIFIPLFGIRAAAIASSAGYLVLFGYLLHEFKKDNPSRLIDYLLIRKSDLGWVKGFIYQSRANGTNS